ncbi:hypothetical protein PR003_g30481 [Phytophthora rubi]|uniref:Uncharacterized protein n=1 Tax=Phytophthora rubi TaxID=129364 RepID=A0A6A3HWA1_9STRA|nr:hypothetical protein PR001_g26723 [Phytophthora rubi]KAE9271532.1 hypothetical protein PR003_g30481 [Phytophthora rubi]
MSGGHELALGAVAAAQLGGCGGAWSLGGVDQGGVQLGVRLTDIDATLPPNTDHRCISKPKTNVSLPLLLLLSALTSRASGCGAARSTGGTRSANWRRGAADTVHVD